MKYNEQVILVHGLARSYRSFTKMAKALMLGGYGVINIRYPSRKYSIEDLADQYLAKAITSCQTNGAYRIHFVTHSMGAILVRYYLNRYTLHELGHVVMLSPPNQGSELVDRLGRLRLFHLINGPAGQQLGTTKHSLPNKLGPVDYPVGVITGNRTINPLLSLLIPGKDDGKVAVERAKVEGMTDFRAMPHTHPLIMKSPSVIKQTQYFLGHGRFSL